MKKIGLLLLVFVLITLAGCSEKVMLVDIGDKEYPTNATVLDLTGKELEDINVLKRFKKLETLIVENTGITPAEYGKLQTLLPECEIVWSVPLQSGSFSSSSEELKLESLSPEDVDMFGYFPHLKKVTVTSGDQFLADFMAQEHPYEVRFDLNIAGLTYDPEDSGIISVENPNAQELLEGLRFMPEVREVNLTGELPDDGQLLQLKQTYPNIAFRWTLTVCGVETDTMATELNLDNIRMKNTDEVDAKLSLFHQLEVVNMNYCGIRDEDMAALRDRHPETKIVWTVKLNKIHHLRTDAVYFMPAKVSGEPLVNADCVKLKYCTDLVIIDLGHHNMTDVSFLQYTPHVEYLVLGDSFVKDITPVGYLKELRFLEIFNTEVTDYWPLLNCTNLEYLNLGYTCAGDMTPIKQMTWLDHLWAPSRSLSKQDRQDLRDALPETHICFELGSSTDNGWRHTPGYYEMRDGVGMYYMFG